MKHTAKITAIIVVMFLISMFIGLFVISSYDQFFGRTSQEIEKEAAEKNITIEKPDVSITQEMVPPPVELKQTIDVVNIIVSILIALAIAVGLFFLLSKIKVHVVIKGWFTIVVFIALTIALTLICYRIFGTHNLVKIFGLNLSVAELIAVPLAIVLTYFKMKKRDVFVHNISELLIYPGIAVVFIPILNVLAASILLILISVYDMIAVWKTKHMQKLAKFQMDKLKIFTGFFIPYAGKKQKNKIKKIKAKLKKLKTKKSKDAFIKKQKIKLNIAVLGGGDVAFPLIFIGTIFLAWGFLPALITIITTGIALTLLLYLAKKGKFYPAMPFLSAGCFLGLLIVSFII